MPGRNVTTIEPLIGRRRDARLRLRLPARVVTLDGTVRATLVDVSRFGARIETGPSSLRPGQDCVLMWDRFETFGIVLWSNGTLHGITLDEPLADETLTMSRAIDAAGRHDEREQAREAAREFVRGQCRL